VRKSRDTHKTLSELKKIGMQAAAGVVDEKGSEYILAHTGPRELDGHPLGGGFGSGFGQFPVIPPFR